MQSKKALLAMYLSEGGMASSGRAAQFIKALTLMVWSVGGRLTSLRLVTSAVHKSKFLDFFNLCVGDINFLQQVTIVTGICPYH